MDLFQLLGTISINNSEANKALDDTSDKGKDAESKLGKAFKAVGKGALAVGKTIATGMAVGGAAVGALVTKSIQSYADYEQLVGGVDTLFKESSAKVQEYAKNAYKTAGMSANEYMETVTSFSASLLQSLGGDTVKAAENANMAITDMSDNANKMGTSMEMIQNAYNGFAKQNYTMLDNLKLGYGGTKEEMQRLLEDAEKISGIKYDLSSFADITEAIHVVQTEMGITGTTAKEAASTISGSIASMKGSWQNLLTAISSDDLPFDDYVNTFVDSVSTVANNLIPRIQIALNGVVSLIDKLAPTLIAKIPELLTSLLPAIITATTSLINSLVAILPSLIDLLVNTVIPQLLAGIGTIINSLLYALPNIVKSIVSALPALIPQLVNGVVGMILTIAQVLPDLIQPIITALPDIVMSLANALLQSLPLLINGLTTLITELVNMLPVVLPELINMVIQLVQLIVEQLPVILPLLVQAIVSIITMLGQQLPSLITHLANGLITIVNILIEQLPVIMPMLIDAVITIVMAITQQLPTILMALIQALPSILQAVWDAIVIVFMNLPQWFGQLFQEVVDVIGGVFSVVPDIFGALIDNLPIVTTLVAGLTAAFIAFNAATIAQKVATLATNAVMSVQQGITTAVTTAQWLLNAALNANPIGLVIIAVTALIAIFVALWNKCDGFRNFFISMWEGIKNVFDAVVNFIKENWQSMLSFLINPLGGVFKYCYEHFDGVVTSIKNFFTGLWNGIKNTFSTVGSFFKDAFSKAWNAIKNVFSGVGTFFSGIWNNIKNTFSTIGTKIGDAISGAVRSGINGLLGSAERIINGFLGMINGAVEIINKIPGVNISKVKLVSFTRLAEGGVVDKPTPAVFGEDGAEAVVPLENNTGWLNKVAKQLHEFSVESKNNLAGALSTRSVDLQQQQLSEMQTLNEKVDNIIMLLIQFFPDMLEALNIKMYLDGDVLVAETADAMDSELGKIAIRKGRGR